jgi:hypothetical protein
LLRAAGALPGRQRVLLPSGSFGDEAPWGWGVGRGTRTAETGRGTGRKPPPPPSLLTSP